MKRKAAIPTGKSRVTEQQSEAAGATAAMKKKATKKTPQASTREGTKVISGHYPESAYKQFKIAATLEGKSLQDALATALNLYLESQRMAPIFPLNKADS